MEFYNINKVLTDCDDFFKPVEDLIPLQKKTDHNKLLKNTMTHLVNEVNKVI